MPARGIRPVADAQTLRRLIRVVRTWCIHLDEHLRHRSDLAKATKLLENANMAKNQIVELMPFVALKTWERAMIEDDLQSVESTLSEQALKMQVVYTYPGAFVSTIGPPPQGLDTF
jgi:hypothetical protein